MRRIELDLRSVETKLAYDPESGTLRWLSVTSNRVQVGAEAGWVSSNGHRYVSIDGMITTVARIAWLLIYKRFPVGALEHLNGDASDCRIINLREVGQERTKNLTVERLKEVLSYDETTGAFRWLTSASKRMRGKSAGSYKNGYVFISINSKLYRAHRLAWLYMTGEWPKHEIDHINGSPSDNRFSNLRPATHPQNCANSVTPITNTSGFKGVSWSKAARKWQAHIRVNGKSIYLGLFDDPAKAHTVYCEAARAARGEFARFR